MYIKTDIENYIDTIKVIDILQLKSGLSIYSVA